MILRPLRSWESRVCSPRRSFSEARAGISLEKILKSGISPLFTFLRVICYTYCMLSWRARRQLIVLFIIALPLLGLGFWFIPEFLPEPTCFDNRKNQEELGVDCGSPCGPCELKNPKALLIFWARAVPVRTNTYDVAAQIQNPNEVLSSANVEYEFTLFDSLGGVARITGQTFILPQERTYIVESNIKTTREPSRVEFKILKADWQFRQEARPSFTVERREYKKVQGGNLEHGVVETSIINNSLFDFREVEVDFAVFDKDGNLIGANKILAENFLAGSRRMIKSIWPMVLNGEVSSIEVETRVNFFEPGVILKPR